MAQAGRDFGVSLTPVRFSPDGLVTQNLANQIIKFCESNVDALLVSIPSQIVADALQGCHQKGVPVVSLNSAAQYALNDSSILIHIGQLELTAGKGSRLLCSPRIG